MIYSDFLRQILLGSAALVFLIFAVWALLNPNSLSKLLGYTLSQPNGFSEFGAIYVGVFVGQSLLCILALSRLDDAAIGDLAAVFLLLQPVGRIIPLVRYGLPTGFVRLLFALEIISGFCLLMVRPEL